MTYTPIEVAVALSLYAYNVSPHERAIKIFEHFDGNCAELDDLVTIMTINEGFIYTELAYPSAKVYVQQALDRYGKEAQERVYANECVHNI